LNRALTENGLILAPKDDLTVLALHWNNQQALSA